MKKLLLIQFVIFTFVGCKKDDNSSKNVSTGSASAVYSFSFKFDGVSYSWSGNQLTNGSSNGQATCSGDNIALMKATNGIADFTITSVIPNFSVGNYSITAFSQSKFFSIVFDPTDFSSMCSTTNGGSMQVTILSIDPNDWSSNPGNTSVGKIKGTFSGTINDVVGGSHSITNGVFEAANMN